MITSPIEALVEWMGREHAYAAEKFGDNQSETLRNLLLSNNASFGGQGASYWARMRSFDGAPDAGLQRAQLAAKLASSTLSLWATFRSLDRRNDRVATRDGLLIASENFGLRDYHDAKSFESTADFWETPVGIGFTYLEAHIRQHKLAPKFRLSQLVRAEQIMTDAASLAVLKFEDCLNEAGSLPKPGLSSGNIEQWLPGEPGA